MNSDDMKTLNELHIKIFKRGISIYSDSMENTISNAQNLESYALYLNNIHEKLETILHMAKKYSLDCINKATDVRKYVDVYDKYKDDPSRIILSRQEMRTKLSWSDIVNKEELQERNSKKCVTPVLENDFECNPILYKNISNITGKNVGDTCKIPIVNTLNEIPSALYWFNGNKSNPKGVYICISHKFYVKIPFPDIVDGTKDFNRVRTIKCKYNNIEECIKKRNSNSNRPNSFIHKCNFAHKGEKYVRVSNVFRCPDMIHFGRHATLKEDLSNIDEYNIKMMLLNSLSDLFISNLWFQTQRKKTLVLTNIDTC
jgi:hypothetical protein